MKTLKLILILYLVKLGTQMFSLVNSGISGIPFIVKPSCSCHTETLTDMYWNPAMLFFQCWSLNLLMNSISYILYVLSQASNSKPTVRKQLQEWKESLNNLFASALKCNYILEQETKKYTLIAEYWLVSGTDSTGFIHVLNGLLRNYVYHYFQCLLFSPTQL